jgi:hypothetical protein
MISLFDSQARHQIKKKILLFLGIGGIFLGVTLIFHHSFLLSGSRKLLAADQSGGFYSWLFWWWHHCLVEGVYPFYTTLVMYPHGTPLFPTAPIVEIPAVVIQFFHDSHFAMNFLSLSTYVLTGVSAFAFFSWLSKSRLGAFCGAFAYAFSAYMIVQHNHGHVTETSLFLNPLVAWAFMTFFERQDRRSTIYLLGALLGLVLCGPYVLFSFGIMFALGIISYQFLSKGKKAIDASLAGKILLVGCAAALWTLLVYYPLITHAGSWIGGAQIYPTVLISFVDFPFWHSSSEIQSLRVAGKSPLFKESSMAYLGLGTTLVLLFILIKGLWRKEPYRLWLWIFCFSAVLSLGSWLHISHGSQTKIPLPYLIFSEIPLFSSFRVPARILMTTTFAASALVSLGLAELFGLLKKKKISIILTGLFVALLVFEMDLFKLGQDATNIKPSGAYSYLHTQSDSMAILELPSAYNPNGDLGTYGTYYMFRQIYHQRPIVLGFPNRFLASSLVFTEKTDVVYELTHPWVIRRLNESPELSGRKEWLIQNGKKVLQENGIGYVLFHSKIRYFDQNTNENLKRFLSDVLGPEVLIDEEGICLFQVRS